MPAVSYVSSSVTSSTETSNADPEVHAHTYGSGLTDGCIVGSVHIGDGSPTNCTGMTWDVAGANEAFTPFTSQIGQSFFVAGIGALPTPGSTGTKNIDYDANGGTGQDYVMGAANFENVDTADAGTLADDLTSNSTISVATETDAMVIDNITMGNDDLAINTTNGHTLLYEVNTFNPNMSDGMGYLLADADPETAQWTFGNDSWTAAALSLNPTTGAAAAARGPNSLTLLGVG